MKPKKQYKYANVEYIKELADGDSEFLTEIIQTFLNTIPPGLDKLKDAVAAKDYKNIAFSAHKMKGSFAFIGCIQLNNTFSLMEHYCTDETKQDQIPAFVTEIATIYETIAMELEDILADNQQ